MTQKYPNKLSFRIQSKNFSFHQTVAHSHQVVASHYRDLIEESDSEKYFDSITDSPIFQDSLEKCVSKKLKKLNHIRNSRLKLRGKSK